MSQEPPIPDPLMVTIMDLEPDQCRFPIGDSDYRFCGHPVHEEGASYCAGHHRLTHLEATPRINLFRIAA